MGNQCCQQKHINLKMQTISEINNNFSPFHHPKTQRSQEKENKSAALDHISVESHGKINQEIIHENSTILLPNGSKYVGIVKAGVPHGFGIQTHECGDKYQGQFKEGIKDGYGTYRFSNGIVYQGQFKGGEMEGKGKMVWGSGDWYEGDFKNNIINGYGKYYSKKNDIYYEGTYRDGKRHGAGVMTGKTTQVKGYWQNGQFVYKKHVPYQY